MRRRGVIAGIRTAAVGLIFLPEPVTTALGVLILGATLAVDRPLNLVKFGDPDPLIRKSLRPHHKPAGFRRLFSPEEKVIRHTINLDQPASLRQAAGPAPRDAEPRQSPAWLDNRRIPHSVVYHTLKTSLPQYEAALAVTARRRQKSQPVIEHHRLKLNPVP